MAVLDVDLVHAWGSPATGACERDVEDRIDAGLVLRAQSGDREAFATLFERHHPAILRLCAARLRRDDAADVAQETFLRAWRCLGSLDDGARFYPWLSVIARNACSDAGRRAARLHVVDEVDEEMPGDGGDASQTVVAAAEAA